jgi:hypothetical protein
MSPTMIAACVTEAPRSRAERAMSGTTAPMPIEMRIVGP